MTRWSRLISRMRTHSPSCTWTQLFLLQNIKEFKPSQAYWKPSVTINVHRMIYNRRMLMCSRFSKTWFRQTILWRPFLKIWILQTAAIWNQRWNSNFAITMCKHPLIETQARIEVRKYVRKCHITAIRIASISLSTFGNAGIHTNFHFLREGWWGGKGGMDSSSEPHEKVRRAEKWQGCKKRTVYERTGVS